MRVGAGGVRTEDHSRCRVRLFLVPLTACFEWATTILRVKVLRGGCEALLIQRVCSSALIMCPMMQQRILIFWGARTDVR